MSDLRRRLTKAVVEALGEHVYEASAAHATIQEAYWPVIEAELQKRDRKLRVFEMNLSASNGALANRIADLNEANKLLEQTIEVLEEFLEIDEDGDADKWFWRQAKPLLDNLKAREKNHGSA